MNHVKSIYKEMKMVYIYQITYIDKAGKYHWVYSTTELLPAAFRAVETYQLAGVYRIQVPENMVKTYLDCKQ